jgi:hypothetical protein
MNVSYSLFTLTPLRRANRMSSLEPKQGVFLKIKGRFEDSYAEYFPHQNLGDRSVEQFLAEFKFQKYEYDQKVFQLLRQDQELRSRHLPTFFNHELWDGSSQTTSPVIKYKLKDEQDLSFIALAMKGTRIRLDANGLFTQETMKSFIKELRNTPIEYMEDPITDGNWDHLPFDLARDFLNGTPFEFYIYKPSCEMRPSHDKLIFSSYLGSDLGRFHAYCELRDFGDLSQYHGIVTKGFHNEDLDLFKGSYSSHWQVDPQELKIMYQRLIKRDWGHLCSL